MNANLDSHIIEFLKDIEFHKHNNHAQNKPAEMFQEWAQRKGYSDIPKNPMFAASFESFLKRLIGEFLKESSDKSFESFERWARARGYEISPCDKATFKKIKKELDGIKTPKKTPSTPDFGSH